MKKTTVKQDFSILGEGVEEFGAVMVDDRHAIYFEEDNLYLVEVEQIKGEEEVYKERPGAEFIVLGRLQEGQPKPTLDEIVERLSAMSALDILCDCLDTQNGCEFNIFGRS